jgi:hypothetical protein
MNDIADSKKIKDRSPNFPFITLQQALDRARQLYAEEKRGAAPYSRLVLHWKYSPNSSGGLQTVAALKSYGLLSELGGTGTARQFQLTELALRILLDTRPDSEERAQFVAQAALTPPVARAVYSNWSEGLPSESTINHFLVLEMRFNEQAAIKAVKILKENQQFARVDCSSVASDTTQIDSEADMEHKPALQPSQPKGPAGPTLGSTVVGGARFVMSRPPTVYGGGASIGGYTENVLLPNGKGMNVTFTEPPDIAMYRHLIAFLEWKVKVFESFDAPKTV